MKYVREPLTEKKRKTRFPRPAPFASLSIPYIIFLVCFIVIPMLLIVLYSVQDPRESTIRFTLGYFRRIFGEWTNLKIIIDSIIIALITTAICLLIGYPTAYIITKIKAKRAKLLILLITAPMWINMLLRTYAWKQILDTSGPINVVLDFLHLLPTIDGISQPIHFLGTDFAIILGMVYIYLPFMILPIYSILQKLDKSYVEASNDLGANKIRTFIKITIPLSLSGVLSGVLMVLLPSATTLIIPKYLGESRYNIGSLIEQTFYTSKQWSFGSALSIVLAIVIMLLVWGIRKLERRDNNENTK